MFEMCVKTINVQRNNNGNIYTRLLIINATENLLTVIKSA